MKHKGSNMEYSRERMADLMRAYDDYIASCRHIRMTDVYSAVVNRPAARFWVSDVRAALVVSAMQRSEADLAGMWALKREMYEEIYRRVQALRSLHPELSTSELCAMVVQQPAPKFYLTAGSAKIMICKARKRWLEEKRKRLRLC